MSASPVVRVALEACGQVVPLDGVGIPGLLVADGEGVLADARRDGVVRAGAGDVDGARLRRLGDGLGLALPRRLDVAALDRPVGRRGRRGHHAGAAPVPALVEVLAERVGVGVRPRAGLLDAGPLLPVPRLPVLADGLEVGDAGDLRGVDLAGVDADVVALERRELDGRPPVGLEALVDGVGLVSRRVADGDHPVVRVGDGRAGAVEVLLADVGLVGLLDDDQDRLGVAPLEVARVAG
jgi:hypothetical protein